MEKEVDGGTLFGKSGGQENAKLFFGLHHITNFLLGTMELREDGLDQIGVIFVHIMKSWFLIYLFLVTVRLKCGICWYIPSLQNLHGIDLLWRIVRRNGFMMQQLRSMVPFQVLWFILSSWFVTLEFSGTMEF